MFVTHSRRLYGANRSLLALLEGFRAAGAAVHAWLPGPGPMADALAARNLPATQAPIPCWVAEMPAPDAASRRPPHARAAAAIARRIAPLRPDVLWSNSSVTAVGALVAATLGVPHVWHLREITGPPTPFRFLAAGPVVTALLRAAAARIAVSRAVRRVYEELGGGPCEVIYSGIGSAVALARRPPPQRPRRPLRILLPARLQRMKGQLAAVEAVSHLRAAGHDVHLRIAGDGDDGAIAAAIARLDLAPAVMLTGFAADLEPEYRQADVVLSCSPIEGMGRVTAEGMSYGLPVVGCASLGTRELLRHEQTGLLCDGSAAGIAAALARLLDDAELAGRLGARAQRVARARFSDERCVAACLAVLARVLAPRAHRLAQTGAGPAASAAAADGCGTMEPPAPAPPRRAKARGSRHAERGVASSRSGEFVRPR